MGSIRIVSKNRVGLLADISGALADEGVNIESVGVDIIGEQAIVVLKVDSVEKATGRLGTQGYHAKRSDSLLIKIPNAPGELNKVTAMLAQGEIDLHSINKLLEGKEYGVFAVVVNRPEEAHKILEDVLIHNY